METSGCPYAARPPPGAAPSLRCFLGGVAPDVRTGNTDKGTRSRCGPDAVPNLCRPSVRFQGHALRARQAASPAGSEHGHGSPKGVDAQCDSGVGVAQTSGDDMNGTPESSKVVACRCLRSCSRACGSCTFGRGARSGLLCARISLVMSEVTVSG